MSTLSSLRNVEDDDDLKKRIDYDFFDDDINGDDDNINGSSHRDADINGLNSKADRIEQSRKAVSNETKRSTTSESSDSSDENYNEEEDNFEELSHSSKYISDEQKVNSSDDSDSEKSSMASNNSLKSSHLHEKSASSLQRSESVKHSSSRSEMKNDSDHLQSNSVSDSESEVTNVSSLSSSPRPIKRIANKSKKSSEKSKSNSHSTIDDDKDVISPEIILQAMMRIHEERRLVRNMKPQWVDPNFKDYSTSGISKKMNMVPEHIVSLSKKSNYRSNLFNSRNFEPQRRPYHTAINRIKELERIEKENKEILMRLRNIRPSPGITREELLKQYTKVNKFSFPKSNSKQESNSSSCRVLSASNSRCVSNINRSQSSTICQSRCSQKSDSHRYVNSNIRTTSPQISRKSRTSKSQRLYSKT